MKKFTTLKEDLIKESASAQEAFDKNFIEAQSKIYMITDKLYEMKKKYEDDLRNWGYAGSLEHVNKELDGILNFLGSENE
jgi:hypothetical protein